MRLGAGRGHVESAAAGAPRRKDADLLRSWRVYDAPRMRVALFSTCLVDALFPDAGKATVTLLERLGQPLEFPLEQTCCGQMHANSGYFEPNLVRRYVDVFDRLRRGRRPVRLVRRRDPPPARDGRPRRRRRGAREPGGGDRRQDVRALAVPDRRAAHRRRRRLLPPPRHLPPDLSLGPDARRRRPPAPAAQDTFAASTSSSCQGTKSAAGSAGRSRSRTRTFPRRCSPTRWSR